MANNFFGENGKKYDSIRQKYPQECIDYIYELSKGRKILDIGCGTGISSRQLESKGFRVVGIDGDDKMLQVSKEYDDSIDYIQASAEELPFEDGSYDNVSAFGSFHWFCNAIAVNEIKRVLKDNGIFFVINKWDRGKYYQILKNVLKRFNCEKSESVKNDYTPFEILQENNFRNVSSGSFISFEEYSIDEIASLAQTSALWKFVDSDIRPNVIEELTKEYSKELNNGVFIRELEVVVVSGIK